MTSWSRDGCALSVRRESSTIGLLVRVLPALAMAVLLLAACSEDAEVDELRGQIATLEARVAEATNTPAAPTQTATSEPSASPTPTSPATTSVESPTPTQTTPPTPSIPTPPPPSTPIPTAIPPETAATPSSSAAPSNRCRGIVAGWENFGEKLSVTYELTVLLDEGGTLVAKGSGHYGGPAGRDWPLGCSR